jgi:RNA polymerase sigma-70 factor (ECF subfamily)
MASVAGEHETTTTPLAETDQVIAAIRSGDATAFALLAERYRRQLHVHCYRMLGSVDDAQDVVQETLLRAWRSRETFEGRSLFRTWLYRIATNVCLNAIERTPRRVMPQDVAQPVRSDFDPSHARSEPPVDLEMPWVQPYPDRLLEPAAPSETGPESIVASRQTIELAFIRALQQLSPKPRATLILRDVLGWSAQETADLLATSVQAVNAALLRARSTMKRDHGVAPVTTLSQNERTLLQRFMDAWERKDPQALTKLLSDDVRWAMPPAPLWFEGRATMARVFELFPLERLGDFRIVGTAANLQPAAAGYLRAYGDSDFRLTGVTVLGIENDEIVELTTFAKPLVAAFKLPATL